MLRNKLVGLMITAMAIATASSAFAGDKEMNFKGIQQIDYGADAATTGSYVPGGLVSSSLELTLNKHKDSVTGVWTAVNSGDSGTIQGVLKDGKLSDIVFISTGSKNVYGIGAYYSSCVFTGELAISKRLIAGALNSTGNSSAYGSACNGVTMTIQVVSDSK